MTSTLAVVAGASPGFFWVAAIHLNRYGDSVNRRYHYSSPSK